MSWMRASAPGPCRETPDIKRMAFGRRGAKGNMMIMYDKGKRDPRHVTVRRGGALQDADHLAMNSGAARSR